MVLIECKSAIKTLIILSILYLWFQGKRRRQIESDYDLLIITDGEATLERRMFAQAIISNRA